MKMKKLLILAVVLSALLSVGPVSLAYEWPPLGDPGSFTVHKFHDANRNGVQDPGEEDVEGWLIRIYRWDDTGIYVVAEGYTGPDGIVTFGDLPAPAKYKVWEEERECWEPTTPNLTSYTWDGGRYTLVWTVSNETIPVDFGNIYTCAAPEACTPGYWKNLRQHGDEWAAAGLDPWADFFDTTFGVAYFDPDITLNDAVRARGGGLGKVARFGTAALLSALHPDVDFALTGGQVIELVRAGDGDALGNLFPDDASCPVD